MTDASSKDSNPTCPACGTSRWYEFSRTTHSAEDCREVAALRAQLAEAQEENRMLTARCDELAGERDDLFQQLDRAWVTHQQIIAHRERAERADAHDGRS